MAFVNRRNKNIKPVSKPETKEENKSKEIISKLVPKRETYLDMTIDVLNTLERSGIDVFDKSRVGGMYQKRGMQQKLQTKNLVNNITKLKGNNNQPETKKETDVDSLLAFFKNNKK